MQPNHHHHMQAQHLWPELTFPNSYSSKCGSPWDHIRPGWATYKACGAGMQLWSSFNKVVQMDTLHIHWPAW